MFVSLNIPDETLVALKLSPDAAEREIVLAAAVKLFEVGQLSSGAAAQLAGLPTPVFLTKLADYGVPVFRLTEGDVARDAQNG
jgi:predicted HTH domain antitoxin